MVLTASRIAELVLFILAITAVTRRRENALVAAWIGLSLAYSLASKLWIEPVLAHYPRPYHGTARWMLHATQALYLAAPLAQLAASWSLLRIRRAGAVAAGAVFVAAMTLLIGGYAHAAGPALYRAGPFLFRSAWIYLAVNVVVDALAWTAVVTRGRESLLLASSASEVAGMVTLGAVLIVGSIRDAFPFAGGHGAQFVPALMLVAYVIGIGAHVPVAIGSMHDAAGRRLEAIFARRRRELRLEIARRRLATSERALAAWHARSPLPVDDADLDEAFPAASRAFGGDLPRLVLASPRLAEASELQCALLGSLPPSDAIAVIEDCLAAIHSAHASGDIASDRPIDKLEWIRLAATQRLSRSDSLEPFALIAIAKFDGLNVADAVRALTVVRDRAIGTVDLDSDCAEDRRIAAGVLPRG